MNKVIQLKLLILIHSMGGGGAERVTANLASYWANKGWDITIVTLTAQNMDVYKLSPAVKRIALAMDGNSKNSFYAMYKNILRIFAVRKVLRQVQPEVAVGMMTGANILLALASWRMSRIRTIGSERTHPPQYSLNVAWQWLRKHCYKHLNAIVALTNESADWLKIYTNSKQVVVVPNPVNWPLVNHPPYSDVEKVCGKNRNILLAVGRLAEEKQISLLIKCFESLFESHSDWDLVVIGEGPLRIALEAQISAAGLINRVFLPGRVGNVGEWYERADIYVMSSRFEGFPNALAEALAYGLPAVSFDCDTGPRDLIRHNVDGLLIPPGDVAALTQTLNRLMQDASLRARLATRAQEVRERYSMERIQGLWQQLFKDIRDN